ncbi:MAG TPA: alpha/beta fold hydrolase [Candidatus Saccharimonadales bacterium]|nr:alpha/beta fold hydrolase [Candidatus Saccharimonadales bacterium]
MIKTIVAFLFLVIVFGGVCYKLLQYPTSVSLAKKTISLTHKKPVTTTPTNTISSPLAIASMREKTYPGSAITIDQTLTPGVNYKQYLVSYKSDGLKIYGLLTVPTGKKPKGGWPVILFNHGYIPPASYSTLSSYQSMVAPLARAGYIVFKPDYRGNGNSKGTPTQPYITPDYVTDSMNALSSIKEYNDANPEKIGVIGHSMGGNITLHEIVLTHDIKAAEFLAGVVGTESDLANWWSHRYADHSIVGNDLDTYYVFEKMIQDNGAPDANPTFWNALDPTKFVDFITAPVQIQVGAADEDVPVNFSSTLTDVLTQKGKVVDYHVYPGANHNLVPDTTVVMNTSVAFFNHYLQ